MAFAIEAHLLEGTYQAATVGRDGAEWPPHPARLFCALVSVADAGDPVQDAALRWLEEQPPPAVRVPAETAEATSPRTAWVPTNAAVTDKNKAPSHAVWPGRANGAEPKTWPQRSLARPELAFVWEADPPGGVRAVLEALARSVPYLGRASGKVLLNATIVTTPVLPGEGWQVWEPVSASSGGFAQWGVDLRIPYGGYLTRLRTAFDAGQPSWQHARSHRYAPRTVPESAEVKEDAKEAVPGPFEDLLTFAFDRGVSVDPVATMAVAGSLREKVMGMLDEYGHDVRAMPAVHGHTDGSGVRPCAYLALPFVGWPRADGRLRGVGVALPRGLEAGHRRALLAVLLRANHGLTRLAVPGMRDPARLSYVGAATGPVQAQRSTVRPELWTAPSRVWSTALPMVLDRFPKRNGYSIEDSVAESCTMAGLPDPVGVEVLRQGALLPGAPVLPGSALRRKRGEPPLPGRHVVIRFAQRVVGPVLIGSKRNFGLGLCLPVREEQVVAS
ncbi:type I-U CRISPR-associated protein Csb2 [Streptomyces radicis]|uniref:Type I-U CRISPR-associated protein Cas5/Cas6 n=1 Tax=Streptomyces radicis TaxID=1750517 RepID=A0A3A9VQ10_9ACTN|nr:type I-U CRISPR-associated protein Csb2 [Streptomyces radicis]RKN03115.1 type I-U CRISPR-associated protein Cas5/Cas6 [Streptomyces radicis]RKN13047.1 type I-U CRISPR-associated protein Cas5/Cas6 [Streptomyces radicis]